MSSKSKSDKSGNSKGQSKPRRSFLPRLPSFRRKKSTSPVSSPDKTPSPTCLDVKEEPILGRIQEGDSYVMRRSKTSELVASFEKRLSDLKDDDEKCSTKTKDDNINNKSDKKLKSPQSVTSKFSRFGFKGLAAHRISSFENRNNNGNGDKARTPEENYEEVNANSPLNNIRKPLSLSNRNLGDSSQDRTDTMRTGSTSSAKSPDSDCSSPGSMTASTKVLGLPMPYRSVFSDEPRGLKRQASSQSVDPVSSGISTTSTSTTPSPCLESKLAAEREGTSQKGMLNATFSLSEPRSLNTIFSEEPKDPFNATFTKDDASGTRLSGGTLTSKTKDRKPALQSKLEVTSHASQQENELSLVKETLISHSEPMPHSAAAGTLGDQHVRRPITGSPGVSLGQDSTVKCHPISKQRHQPKSDTQNNTQSNHNRVRTATSGSEQIITNRSESVSASAAEKPVDNMGSTHSALEPNAISTPARPLHLSLKPHLSAIKHGSESFDSAELDSLASDDLMCDSRYLDDEAFDQMGDESARLSRSCGMESVLATHRYHNGWGNRNRTSSLDQMTVPNNVDKRVNLSRGMSTPSPLGVTPRSKRRGNRGASQSVSAMDELGHLIGSTVLTDRQQFGAHNTNRNRSNSSLTSTAHPLRVPRWLSHQDDEEDVVVVDAVVYRHMIQDITYLKTMLLRLKRALQQTETSSPFEHPLRSPFNSVPTSPMSDTYLLPDSSVADLAEENQVLRKEVKKLQELLVDKESDFNTLSKQLTKPDNKHTGTQCEDTQASASSTTTSPSHCAASSSSTDKCLQVDLPLNGQQCQQPHTFYEHQQQQQQQQMEQQIQPCVHEQQQLQQQQQQFAEEQSPQSQLNQPQLQGLGETHLIRPQVDYVGYPHPEEEIHFMACCESMTSSTSSLTSEETRSSSRSLSSPTKRMDIPHDVELDSRQQQHHQQQQQQQEELLIRDQQQQCKESPDDSSSDSMQTTGHCEMHRQPVHCEAAKQDIVYQSKLPASSRAGSPKKEQIPERKKEEKQQTYNEPKQGLSKKKHSSKSRLVAPSSVSAKVLSQDRMGKGRDTDASVKKSRGVFKKQTPVTEIETVVTTSWEPLVDVTGSSKYKSIVTQTATTSHKSHLPKTNSRSSIQPPTAYSSYQQKSGLRAPSQRVNQMPSASSLQAPKGVSHLPGSAPSSRSGSSERLSDAPASPKRSSPQHSLRTTLSQPVPSKLRTGLPSPKRARQIPMGVTQMQSQMAASSQNKSPKRSVNGRRDAAVVKPGKSQEQVWEKQMNGSNYPDHSKVVTISPQTSPQRQLRQPGSKIAIPIRGRGGSKLPRTSIPSRRYDPNM